MKIENDYFPFYALGTDLSKLLNQKMLVRQGEVFNTEFFNAVLFLDHRFNQSLNENQKENALKCIVKVAEYVSTAENTGQNGSRLG